MISILDPTLWLAVMLALVVTGGVANCAGRQDGWKGGAASVQAAWNADKLKQAKAVADAKTKDAQAGQSASADYQKEKAHETEKIRVVRQTIVRTVPVPCLADDGLRNLNAAIGGVPASPASR